MPLSFPKRLTVSLTLLSMLTCLSACADSVPNACAWLHEISPDPGFETRWTRAEKVQVDTLDKSIDANCGRPT